MEEKKGLFARMKESIKNHKGAYFLVFILLFGAGYYVYYKKTSGAETAVSYRTEAAQKGNLSVTVNGTGQVESITQVDLKPVVAGDSTEVSVVYVKNDQLVKKDQLIALLDAKDALKSVRNAELSLESAKVKYDSVKRQYDRDQVSKFDKESQKLAVEQAENSLQDAQENLQDYYIRAPFDGIVTNLSVESGDSISRSDILASVITVDSHAVISLNEVDAAKVKEGDLATLTFDALPDISIAGKVTKIDTIGTVNQGVVSYGAEISFDSQNEMLKPGMSVSAEISVESKEDVLLVPSGAVKTQNGKNFVLILSEPSSGRGSGSEVQENVTANMVNAPTPERRQVEVGITNNIYTEIRSGLSVGENVVTETVSGGTQAASVTTGSGAGNATRSSSSSSLHIPGLGGGGGRN